MFLVRNTASYMLQGQVCLLKKDMAGAIAFFTRALEVNPNLLEGYLQRAWCFTSREMAPAVIADFSQVLRLDPDHARAYMYRGALYHGQKEYQRALADLNSSHCTGPAI